MTSYVPCKGCGKPIRTGRKSGTGLCLSCYRSEPDAPGVSQLTPEATAADWEKGSAKLLASLWRSHPTILNNLAMNGSGNVYRPRRAA